jgi:hypothetical protein
MEGLEEYERTDEEELMLHGRCHLFAVAMSDLTGYPIGAYLDTDLDTGGTRKAVTPATKAASSRLLGRSF